MVESRNPPSFSLANFGDLGDCDYLGDRYGVVSI